MREVLCYTVRLSLARDSLRHLSSLRVVELIAALNVGTSGIVSSVGSLASFPSTAPSATSKLSAASTSQSRSPLDQSLELGPLKVFPTIFRIGSLLFRVLSNLHATREKRSSVMSLQQCLVLLFL